MIVRGTRINMWGTSLLTLQPCHLPVTASDMSRQKCIIDQQLIHNFSKSRKSKKFKMPYKDPVIIDPWDPSQNPKDTATIIFLHGFGDDAEGWRGIYIPSTCQPQNNNISPALPGSLLTPYRRTIPT